MCRNDMRYAIGDIHGLFDPLERLYNNILVDIERHGEKDNTVIFLGDYIDRGTQNQMVMDFLMSLEDRPNITHRFLLGNHDQMLMDVIGNPKNQRNISMWVNNGGISVLNELGVSGSIQELIADDRVLTWTQWFEGHTESYIQEDGYCFVHGGFNAPLFTMGGGDIDKFDKDTLIWTREISQDYYKGLPFLVVHGHTAACLLGPHEDDGRVCMETRQRRDGLLYAVALPNQRCLDQTGHYYMSSSFPK